MLAGRITAQGKVELVEIAEPELSASSEPGQIIFEPAITCLCGSDLPFVYEKQPEYPLTDGLSLHEMVGTVTATNGNRFRPGDRVLAVPVDQVGLFERYQLSETRAIPLDPRQPPEIAMMAQPLGTAIFALRKLPNLLGLDVAIVGQGPMGQIFNACLRNLGARKIIGIDRVEGRLAISKQTGATHTIDTSQADAAEAVARLTDGTGADVVIEAVGHAGQQLNLCVDLCRKNGKLFSFGVPPREALDGVEWSKLFFKNIRVYTSVNPDFELDFPLAMQWISEGRVDMSPIITHHFELADIQQAFETFHKKTDGALKVVVRFPAAERF